MAFLAAALFCLFLINTNAWVYKMLTSSVSWRAGVIGNIRFACILFSEHVCTDSSLLLLMTVCVSWHLVVYASYMNNYRGMSLLNSLPNHYCITVCCTFMSATALYMSTRRMWAGTSWYLQLCCPVWDYIIYVLNYRPTVYIASCFLLRLPLFIVYITLLPWPNSLFYLFC